MTQLKEDQIKQDQLKQAQNRKQLNDMLFFQNLIPGKQQSFLIDDFREKCINTEDNKELRTQRESLLNKFPPILSFKDEDEKDEFYKDECEKGLGQFCCGGIRPVSENSWNENAFSAKDYYLFSPDGSQFYAGSEKTITDAIQQTIKEGTLDSTTQKEHEAGFQAFSRAASGREQDIVSMSLPNNTQNSQNLLGEFDTVQPNGNHNSAHEENVNEIDNNESMYGINPS